MLTSYSSLLGSYRPQKKRFQVGLVGDQVSLKEPRGLRFLLRGLQYQLRFAITFFLAVSVRIIALRVLL